MKVVSLSPATTEILFAVGAGNTVVADTYFCDFPEQAKKIPKIGSFTDIHFEKIVELHPDLVLSSTIVQTRIYRTLQEMKINVVHFDPRSIQGIIESIQSIGNLVHHEKEATCIVIQMQNEIDKLQESPPKHKPRIYIEEWYDPPMYSGNWVPELVELAGGKYAFSINNGVSKVTSETEVLNFDPEYIFVSYCGFGTKSDTKKILNRKNWQNVSAIKNKKVYPLNETILNRPGPRILQSAGEIRRHLNDR